MSFQESSVFVWLSQDAEQNQQAWKRPQWSMPTNKIKQTDHRLARRFSAPIVRSFFYTTDTSRTHRGDLCNKSILTNKRLSNASTLRSLHNKSSKSQFKTVGWNSQWDFKTRTLQSCRKKTCFYTTLSDFFVCLSPKKDPFVNTISEMVRRNSSSIQIHAPICNIKHLQ